MGETYQFGLDGLIINGSVWVVNGYYRTTLRPGSMEVYPYRTPLLVDPVLFCSMTLSIAYVSGFECIVATDRRISGGVSDDEHGKTIALFAGDGIAAVSFAGLAKASHFETHGWLANSLKDMGGELGSLRQIIRDTADALTRRFKNNRSLNAIDHRLSVLFAGYGFGADSYYPFFALVSNFQHPDNRGLTQEFGAYLHQLLPSGDHLACVIGDYNAISPETFAEVRQRCMGKERKLIERILVGAIRTAATKSPTIGKQVMTLALDPIRPQNISGYYHSSKAKRELAMATSVWAQPDTRIAVLRPTITAFDAPDHRFIFPTPGRNSRCLCGSGKKHKHCHGKK